MKIYAKLKTKISGTDKTSKKLQEEKKKKIIDKLSEKNYTVIEEFENLEIWVEVTPARGSRVNKDTIYLVANCPGIQLMSYEIEKVKIVSSL